MTTAEFYRWLHAARPGDRVVYYSGHLGEDRGSAVGEAALRAAGYRWHAVGGSSFGSGWQHETPAAVLLVQARCPLGGFNYIAVRTGESAA